MNVKIYKFTEPQIYKSRNKRKQMSYQQMKITSRVNKDDHEVWLEVLINLIETLKFAGIFEQSVTGRFIFRAELLQVPG